MKKILILFLAYGCSNDPYIAPGHSTRPLTPDEEKEVTRQAIEEYRLERQLDSMLKSHDKFAKER